MLYLSDMTPVTANNQPQDLKLLLDDGLQNADLIRWQIQNIDPRVAVFLSDSEMPPAAGSDWGLYLEPGASAVILPGNGPLWCWTVRGLATVACTNAATIKL